jgi:uncharacterized membrane protein YeiH
MNFSSLKRIFPNYRQDVVLLITDLAGTFVFAVEGALAGIRAELDVFGLLVVSFATALGGGVIRDLMIGAVPPNSIRDWRYATTAFAGGAAVFCFYPSIRQIPSGLMLTLDAAGLALFAVAGAAKALEYKIGPLPAVLMGTLTGVGGGTIRDILLTQVPGVLRTDIYAVAALTGASVMVVGIKANFSQRSAMIAGGICCFTLRMVALSYHWNLARLMVQLH